jgi:hypothetical protein
MNRLFQLLSSWPKNSFLHSIILFCDTSIACAFFQVICLNINILGMGSLLHLVISLQLMEEKTNHFLVFL